jgi:molybdopterin molybdotransferase
VRPIGVHRQAALALVHPMPATRVSIEASDAHVLAHDVRAPSALPRWDNSAMDGYAWGCPGFRGTSVAAR